MRIAKCLLVATMVLCAWSTPARADSSATFDMTGTFQICAYGSSCPLGSTPAGNFTGSLTIDTTAGKVTAFSLNDPTSFGGACDITLYPPCGLVVDALVATDAGGDTFRVDLLESSLVGVTSLSADPSKLGTSGTDVFFDNTVLSDSKCLDEDCDITSITFTYVPSSAPEPGSFALLAFGISTVAVAGVFRRRRLA